MRPTLYALSTCPYCRMARKFLDSQGVDYMLVEVDLLEGEEKKDALAAVREISGGTSFPVLHSGDDVVVGFNKVKTKKVLGL